MSFWQYLEQSKLQRLLDFYNLEEIAWHLQDLLFTDDLVPLTVKDTGNLKDHFQSQYNFSLQLFSLERGVYRLVKHFPEFSVPGNQFLYFDDDLLQFFDLKNQVLPKYALTGRQILVNTHLKPQDLSNLIPPGPYFIKVIPGHQRQDMNRYLETLNPREWEEKSHLSWALRELFRKQDSLETVQSILNQRSQYLKINLPQISLDRKLTAVADINRGEEMMKLYNLPNIPLTASKSTIYIKALLTHFPKNTTPQEFLKDLTRVKSYEYHLEKFIRQLVYLYKKAQRAKL
jgi:hypothetical protein